MVPTRSVRLAVIGGCIALYLVSLYMDAIQFIENPGTPNTHIIAHSGIIMFFMSIFGPLSGNFAILANPLLWAGWLMIWSQKYRGAVITLAIAFLFTLQTFQLRGQLIDEDEGGVNVSYMNHLLPGWYVWVLAILIPLAAAAYFKWFAPKPPTPPAPEPPSPTPA
jgi:hypothetical protein